MSGGIKLLYPPRMHKRVEDAMREQMAPPAHRRQIARFARIVARLEQRAVQDLLHIISTEFLIMGPKVRPEMLRDGIESVLEHYCESLPELLHDALAERRRMRKQYRVPTALEWLFWQDVTLLRVTVNDDGVQAYPATLHAYEKKLLALFRACRKDDPRLEHIKDMLEIVQRKGRGPALVLSRVEHYLAAWRKKRAIVNPPLQADPYNRND